MRYAILLGVLLLASCAHHDYAAEDRAMCAQYGFQDGTDAFQNCRLQLAIARQNEEASRQAAFGAMMMGHQMQRTVP